MTDLEYKIAILNLRTAFILGYISKEEYITRMRHTMKQQSIFIAQRAYQMISRRAA